MVAHWLSLSQTYRFRDRDSPERLLEDSYHGRGMTGSAGLRGARRGCPGPRHPRAMCGEAPAGRAAPFSRAGRLGARGAANDRLLGAAAGGGDAAGESLQVELY